MNGLTTKEVEFRIKNGLVNKRVKYSRSIKDIILSNIFTLFNFINLFLFILVLTTKSYRNGLFAIVIVINTIISIYGEIKAKLIIDKLSIVNNTKVSVIRDGKTIKIMTSAQDHKRAKDGDQGLNTGGMGTFSPSPFYTEEVDDFCKKYVYQATVDAMASEGRPFKGIIFFGLMLTEDGPKVLEYNARFGDPEAQVVLPRMKNDLVDVMEACIDGELGNVELQFEENAAVCVVLASDGYPENYEKGFPIRGLDSFHNKEGYYAFHAGTRWEGNTVVTNGGRVLGVTAKGENLKVARANAYEAVKWIDFDNKYCRGDIGKAIDEV